MDRRSQKTLKSTFILAALVLGLTLVGLACGGDGGTKSGEADAAAGGGPASFELSMGDNFFDLKGTHNPRLEIAAGATVEIKLTNKGNAIHNMRFAGADNQYNSGDDAVSDPNPVQAGQTAVIKFTAPKQPGTYKYQCDFHPTDSKGEVIVK